MRDIFRKRVKVEHVNMRAFLSFSHSFTRVACSFTIKQINLPCQAGCIHNTFHYSTSYNLFASVGHLHAQSFVPSRNYARKAKESITEEEEDQLTDSEKPPSQGPTPTRKTQFWKNTGDLIEKEPINKSEIFFPYLPLKDKLEKAPEHVRKLATLEFCDGQQRLAHSVWKIRQKISHVCRDGDDEEFRIARMTLQIRNLKEHMKEVRMDITARIILNDLIFKRNKKLKVLRRRDYESFMWLLKMLQIRYVPADNTPRESKRAKMKRLVQEEADARVKAKFDTIQARFDKEKKEFKAERTQIMEQVQSDIEQYKFDPDWLYFKVEKARREAIEERKGYAIPPENTFQYLRYLRRQKKMKSIDKSMCWKIIRGKKTKEERDAAWRYAREILD